MDRAYFESKWWLKLHENKFSFITRLKSGVIYRTSSSKCLKEHESECNFREEKIIQFMGTASQNFSENLRVIVVHDPEKNENAMLMQIWTAILAYLLIWRMHQESAFCNDRMLSFLRYLQARLMLPDAELRLFPPKKKIPHQYQMF